jgi:Tol biopolymer transport system component
MRIVLILTVISFITLVSCTRRQKTDFPVLKGLYLGQTPPGTTPVVFAPGIVSTGLYTRDIAISKDGKEIYFCVSDAAATSIFVTKLCNGRWTEPVIAEFSGNGFLDLEPHISPDGTKFFFMSNRPPHDKEPKNGWYYQKIWMMNKTESGWSEPLLVDEPVGTEENEFFPSVTNENVLYFTRSTKSGKAMIYKSRFENGMYQVPEMLPFSLPENGLLFNAYISPKEDFMITCALNIDSLNTDQDYFISFKTSQGKWSKLIKFGPEINTPDDNANSAFVSPDGKYLFFSSSRRNQVTSQTKSGTSLKAIIDSKSIPGTGSSAIYWVDAKIIDELRLKVLK